MSFAGRDTSTIAEVSVDDTSDPDGDHDDDYGDRSHEEGSSTADDDGDMAISLAATENELLEKVREWFYVLLCGTGLVATLFIGIALHYSQQANLHRAFHMLLPAADDETTVSFRRQRAALQQVAAQRVRGAWPRAVVPHLTGDEVEAASQWLDQTSILPVVWQRERLAYEAFTIEHAKDWLLVDDGNNRESMTLGDRKGSAVATDRSLLVDDATSMSIHAQIFDINGNVSPDDRDVYLPLWQTAVATAPSTTTTTTTANLSSDFANYVNVDVQSIAALGATELLASWILANGTTTTARVGPPLWGTSAFDALVNATKTTTTTTTTAGVAVAAGALTHHHDNGSHQKKEPWMPILLPIRADAEIGAYDNNDEPHQQSALQAVVLGVFSWRRVLPQLSSGYLSLEVATTCEGGGGYNNVTKTSHATYRGSKGRLVFQGSSDHAPHSSHHRLHKTYTILADDDDVDPSNMDPAGRCNHTLFLTPSPDLYHEYVTWYSPLLYAAIFLTFSGLVGVLFHGYDVLVEERQKIVLSHSVQADAILSSLFPRQVRDRLLRRNSNASVPQQEENAARVSVVDGGVVEVASAHRIKQFLTTDGGGGDGGEQSDSPIADLFPHCTVMFADIAGFTAWSSLRDPSQVFKLLEAVYSAFDAIARRRGVFKVETIGDSYVCVTGLPDPQRDHALIMGRFARDCRIKFKEVTRKLELSLGPDTGDLCMRFGMHSGPVTAGVLRGEKSRFQLFGDTVNTAARMESTGVRDCIQVSQATADLLIDDGKGYWLRPRDTTVHAKGKGEMQTFWIDPIGGRNRNASLSSDTSDASPSQKHLGESAIWGVRSELSDVELQRNKHQRLIDYNVDLLTTHLKRVVARRKVTERLKRRGSSCLAPRLDDGALSTATSTVLDEVVPVIRLPQFDANAFKAQIDPDSIELPDVVQTQLKRYVTVIAAMYRHNPFHNWEHASHVVLSVNKLLQRVVAPEIRMRRRSVHTMDANEVKRQVYSDLHNYTHGITSDPLTQFAIIFAALIHDLDHYGVSNSQLIKEDSPIARKYRNKSVAEQNSVDLAWDLLMDKDEYGDFQQCIFVNQSEFKRFRQVVCNLVMATDIFDSELQTLRKDRWEKAFNDRAAFDEDYENRKATIVIEHIMQASDVAHTMQHWHIYQKWNRRLFDEMYTAYRSGRMAVDPSTFWYEGELKFFDSYVVPLAKKLKECNVFGVASDECLNYALDNRREWENKGKNIVQELVSSFITRETEETPGLKQKKNRFARRRSLMTSGG